ncbi:MAG TPA: hypothetical protein VNU45_09210 [Rummeliibacillus sp.]|nr:hypothetical protein [Rummeliibacillus sp.]
MDNCPTPRSVEHCKDLLRTIGKMLCVKAELISTKLLSSEDKQDMLDGVITDEALFFAVKGWMEAGMPDYSGSSVNDAGGVISETHLKV